MHRACSASGTYVALAAVIEDGLRDEPGAAMPWTVLDRLRQLIPSHCAQFKELDLDGRVALMDQIFYDGGERFIEAGDIVDGDAAFWDLRADFGPYRYQASTKDLLHGLGAEE